ncbi:MAG: exosortase-associated EpsI family protein [Verrucomicrobia bacterium]|nr:exosortase-associated EpsI family protein [Verrucomicrobiota bacterium]
MTAAPLTVAWRTLAPPDRLVVVGLLLAPLALAVKLWPQWGSNPDLSHGYFMPLLFLVLLQESRQGTPRHLAPGPARTLLCGGLLGIALVALATAGLYAASVDWSHALVNVMLTTATAAFIGACVTVLSSSGTRLLGWNWPVLAAALLWLLTAPIPPGTYTRLTLALQLWVSEGVLRTLHLLGIAAIRHGNIIDLANASVGVEEACSGVRSLISCIFAGLFFSATLVRRPWARVLLVGLAAPLALGMNFLRSLALTLLANQGVSIAGAWHDVTGFAVLGLTAAILGALALVLERRPDGVGADPQTPAAVPATTGGRAEAWAVVSGLGIAAALVAGFVWNTRPAVNRAAPVPDLAALLPDSVPGWQVRTANLFEFRGTLQTDLLAQRSYVRTVEGAPPTEIVIYAAYWRAGQAPVSLVAAHTPDACWPGAGWTPVEGAPPRVSLSVDGPPLPPAEHRVFTASGLPHRVWYWHLYAGRAISYDNPYSAIELLRLALRFGFRRGGDQVFIRVSSNRPWEEIRDAPPLQAFLARARPLGL